MREKVTRVIDFHVDKLKEALGLPKNVTILSADYSIYKGNFVFVELVREFDKNKLSPGG